MVINRPVMGLASSCGGPARPSTEETTLPPCRKASPRSASCDGCLKVHGLGGVIRQARIWESSVHCTSSCLRGMRHGALSGSRIRLLPPRGVRADPVSAARAHLAPSPALTRPLRSRPDSSLAPRRRERRDRRQEPRTASVRAPGALHLPFGLMQCARLGQTGPSRRRREGRAVEAVGVQEPGSVGVGPSARQVPEPQ